MSHHPSLCLLGLTLMAAIYWPRWSTITYKASDFSATWVAAIQVGHADIYAEKPYIAFETSQGAPRYLRVYLRFPWHALMAKPFTILPYSAAACV